MKLTRDETSKDENYYGLFAKIPESGISGPLSSLFRKKKKKSVSEEVASDVASAGVEKFKKGGRIDGCAIRGKTNCKTKSYK